MGVALPTPGRARLFGLRARHIRIARTIFVRQKLLHNMLLHAALHQPAHPAVSRLMRHHTPGAPPGISTRL